MDNILRRTTFIVADIEAAIAFYTSVFGWTVWYDNTLAPDPRFPPAAPAGTKCRLVILKVDDPEIGMLGFMQYEIDIPSIFPRKEDKVRTGDAILVINSEDPDAVYERAKQTKANIVAPPVDWEVPSHDGKGTIKLRTMSLFDPNGIYMEVNRRGG